MISIVLAFRSIDLVFSNLLSHIYISIMCNYQSIRIFISNLPGLLLSYIPRIANL